MLAAKLGEQSSISQAEKAELVKESKAAEAELHVILQNTATGTSEASPGKTLTSGELQGLLKMLKTCQLRFTGVSREGSFAKFERPWPTP